jgi:hypothetical protein
MAPFGVNGEPPRPGYKKMIAREVLAEYTNFSGYPLLRVVGIRSGWRRVYGLLWVHE